MPPSWRFRVLPEPFGPPSRPIARADPTVKLPGRSLARTLPVTLHLPRAHGRLLAARGNRSRLSQFPRSSLAHQRESAVRGNPPEGRCMQRRLIWIDGGDFTGWCCSVCAWGMTAPRLDSTAAALAFNCVAQETFAKHDCAGNSGLLKNSFSSLICHRMRS